MNLSSVHNRIAESFDSVILFFLSLNNVLDASSLWSASLKPTKSLSDISKEASDLGEHLALISSAFSEVVSKRVEISKNQDSTDSLGGRFLIYSPLHATMDSLACGETSNFFDEADAPPWSTWVAYQAFVDDKSKQYEGYLAAWIPEELIDVAQSGIDVSLGKSLFWADDLDEVSTYGDNAVAFCKEVVAIKR